MKLLATICTKLHVYEDSEFLLESCLVFEPDNIHTSIEYINLLIKRQKYGPALNYAKKLYDKNENNISVQTCYAITLQQTDNQKEALKLYSKILEKNPNIPNLLLSRGHLYKNFGQINKSIESYKSAYQLNKSFGDSYWSLANLKTYKYTQKEISLLKV